MFLSYIICLVITEFESEMMQPKKIQAEGFIQ